MLVSSNLQREKYDVLRCDGWINRDDGLIEMMGGWYYCAWASIHRSLVEGLAHREGHMSGPHASGSLNGEAFPLLCNLNGWFGGCCDCNLPQKDIYA